VPNGSNGQRRLAVLGPAALVLGFVLGSLAHGSPIVWPLSVLEPVGELWTNGLRLTVVPLAASLLVAGIAGAPQGAQVGKWSRWAIGTFIAMLVAGALYTLAVGRLALEAVPPQPLQTFLQPEAGPAASALSFSDWFTSLVPANAFEAVAKGDLLPVALLSTAFGLALRQIAEDRRQPVVAFFEVVRDAVLKIVAWLLAVLPLGAFALAYTFAAAEGLAAAGAVVHFIVFCGLLLVGFAGLLYLAAALGGRQSLAAFAVAAAPSQTVAISTRSSLASLPALVDGAKRLNLPPSAAGLVLPLSVAFFKANRTVSSTAKLLFLSAMLGLALDPARVAGFVATVMLLSFATPGIPSGGRAATLGAYVAAGLPAEVVLLFEAADPALDVVKTGTNVTANLAAACIVSRHATEAEAVPA
jgi:proton glutamate symport protein